MATKKKVATATETVIKKGKAELHDFSFETTVSTGAYSNVKMNVTITAETILDAISMATVPIRKLHQEFFLMTERRTAPAKVEVKETVVTPTPVEPTKITVDGQPTGMEVPITEAFTRASKAVDDAITAEAIEVVIGQIGKSSKLSGFEKDKLTTAALLKIKALNK